MLNSRTCTGRVAVAAVVMAGAALWITPASARVSLADLEAGIEELRTSVCGPEADCTTEFALSVDQRLDEVERRADEMTEALCDLLRDAGGALPVELGCSSDGELRLVGGADNSEGRLEIKFDEVWGTVCDDAFGAEEALVACRQMGFSEGVPVFTREFGTGTGPIFLDDVICAGTESRLEECRNRGVGVHNCSHFEDVGVRCSNPAAMTGALRLQDGPDASSGRLEVLLEDGAWGSVCDDQFDNVDAGVACRDLGFSDGTFAAIRNTSIPIGTGAIALDDVACDGTEGRLVDCPNRGLGLHNCSHFEDVVVNCL